MSENGIEAEVIETLDYGAEKFVKCAVGEQVLFVKCDNALNGKIRLLPDAGKVSVVETERQIRIV